jgi:hypothetical protein
MRKNNNYSDPALQENYSEIIPEVFFGVAQTYVLNGVVDENRKTIEKRKTTLMAAAKVMDAFDEVAIAYGNKRKWAVFTVALLAMLRMKEHDVQIQVEEIAGLSREERLTDLVKEAAVASGAAKRRQLLQARAAKYADEVPKREPHRKAINE